MKKYALIGERLEHSYSMIVHRDIYEEWGIDATFELLECSEDELPMMVKKLKTGEYSGYNVTFPYKKTIMKYIDIISDEAKHIGSVNTIYVVDGKTIGYNTDYFGFYYELLYYRVPVHGKDCYVLGTGGAALAVRKALVDLGGNVYYVSRHPEGKNTISYQELENRKIDVLVNATPVGLYPDVDKSPVSKEIAKKAAYALDCIFNPSVTKMLEYNGSKMNGLFMLVYQAIKAEELFQNREYDGDIDALLRKIEAEI